MAGPLATGLTVLAGRTTGHARHSPETGRATPTRLRGRAVIMVGTKRKARPSTHAVVGPAPTLLGVRRPLAWVPTQGAPTGPRGVLGGLTFRRGITTSTRGVAGIVAVSKAVLGRHGVTKVPKGPCGRAPAPATDGLAEDPRPALRTATAAPARALTEALAPSLRARAILSGGRTAKAKAAAPLIATVIAMGKATSP